MASAVSAVARSRASCNPPPAPALPPSFPSHELPDVLSGWRAGRIGEPCDSTHSASWRWGWECGSGEGRAVH